MPTKRHLPTSLLIALACAARGAAAMGFEAAPQSALLGQPLDLSIPLRLEPGESLGAQCIQVEVTVGDRVLGAGQVRARIENTGGAALARVVTMGVVDEPVVAVNVAIGCPARVSRSFVLLADPAPTLPSAPVTPPAEVLAAEPPSAPTSEPPPKAAAPALADAVAPVPATAPGAARRAAQAGTRAASAPQATRPRRVAVRREAPALRAPGTDLAHAAPRLKLDAAEPPVAALPLPAPLPPEPAASLPAAPDTVAAAAASASAASAAAARIAALERAIDKLRTDAQSDRQALQQLRATAAEADLARRLMPYLLLGLGALALLASWLGLRLRRLQRERQADWWKAAAAGQAQAAAAAATPAQASTAPSELPGTMPASPAFAPALEADDDERFAPAESAPQRTQPLPPQWREDAAAERDVSVEELIDLEQQAEFFIVLGQEEAAIDLLVDHLRSTGGGSPLPYLKLLEIYRRRGDREAYERTRTRFNHRFNAYAPDWDADIQQGRSLEEYPGIVARLQMAWPAPLDAMAELEALLFRKSRGELFDMAAYRDLLFLYSLARDLLDREPLESGKVDVLLPLTEGAVHTRPLPLEDGPEGVPSGLPPMDAQPTVPVDLDLTQPVMPDSIFGELPTEPGRRL